MGFFDFLKILSQNLAAPAIIKPTTTLASRIVEAAEGQLYGAQLSRTPGTGNLVYGEGMNEDGSWNGNPIDKWNDRRLIIAWSGYDGYPVIIGNWPATTTVGFFYDVAHPLHPERGAPLIAWGQQACWQIGIHHPGGQHEALVQTGGRVECYFDPDRVFQRYGQTEKGWWGINHHGPGTNHPVANPDSVEGYSAGCLVAQTMAAHRASMALLKTDVRYLGNQQYIFDATVIPASAFN
jgi:hypothetical protein